MRHFAPRILRARGADLARALVRAAPLPRFSRRVRSPANSRPPRRPHSAPAARSFFYYAWKLVSTLAILGVAAFVTMRPGAGFLEKMGGALLVALFWQQCGWLAHDFAHHQVFGDRSWNDAGVLFVGNFLQAFSLEWWKNKHNTHHAIPNLHETQAEAHDGDPDIDTLPFLAWSQRFVDKTKAGGAAASPTARFFVRNQALLYFPVLFFARITWALSSIAYAFSLDVSLFGSEAEIVKGVQAKLAAAAKTAGGAPMTQFEILLKSGIAAADIPAFTAPGSGGPCSTLPPSISGWMRWPGSLNAANCASAPASCSRVRATRRGPCRAWRWGVADPATLAPSGGPWPAARRWRP